MLKESIVLIVHNIFDNSGTDVVRNRLKFVFFFMDKQIDICGQEFQEFVLSFCSVFACQKPFYEIISFYVLVNRERNQYSI